MKSTIRIIYLLLIILITLPHISVAAELISIYGAKIHLTNNGILDGYIETYWDLDVCKGDLTKGKSFLEKQRELQTDTVRFIDKLIEIKYDKGWSPYTAKSSVKEIEIDDIKSIEGVCKNWNGYETASGIQIITDSMAQYVFNHKLIAFYIYDQSALAEEGKISGEDCGLCSCATTYLSYNPEYSSKRLMKLRKKIDKMSNDILDKERLIKFTHCWD